MFAVHLADGILRWPWWTLGNICAGLFVWMSLRHLRDDEIPRIGILGAAFFLGSLVHLRLGPTSVHLLLTGPLALGLGIRCVPAIFLGLLLQAFLLGHGGFTTLGLNLLILALPALLLPRLLNRPTLPGPTQAFPMAFAAILGVECVPLAWLFARLTDQIGDGFRLGFGCVMASAVLNAMVLLFAGEEDWTAVAVFVIAAHLPIAVLEGFVTTAMMPFVRKSSECGARF